jgi:hypothetical protein
VVHAIAQLGVRIQRSNDHLYGRARHNINPLHNWPASLTDRGLTAEHRPPAPPKPIRRKRANVSDLGRNRGHVCLQRQANEEKGGLF